MKAAEDLKEAYQTEREKLSRMNGRQKADYLWTYYKLHFLGLAALLFFLYAAASILARQSYHTRLCLLVLNNYYGQTRESFLTQTYHDFRNMTKKEELLLDEEYISRSGQEDSEHDFAVKTKIAAMITVEDLDVLIMDGENTAAYAAEEVLLDLEETLAETEKQELADRLLYLPARDGRTYAAALRIDETPGAAALGLQEPAVCFSIAANSQRTEEALRFLHYLLEADES